MLCLDLDAIEISLNSFFVKVSEKSKKVRMMTTGQDDNHEPELVELHFELEIDYRHAFEENEIITQCIAEVMKISKSDVFFDGVDEIMKDDQYCGLFRGHIPTTKHEIEKLVSIFYNSLQTQELQQKIVQYSGIENPVLEIRELYETDQNDDDQEFLDEIQQNEAQLQHQMQQEQQSKYSQQNNLDAIDGQQHDPYNQQINNQRRGDDNQYNKSHNLNSVKLYIFIFLL